MNELVHWILHSRSLSSLRVPSFAGKGLPERMRSTVFALLGMTAAAGLALVAIFAQPGFPLLDPAPLPNEPSASQAVAQAEKLTLSHKPSAFTVAVASRAVAPAPAFAGSRAHGSKDGSTGSGDDSGGEAAVQSPAPSVSTPEAAEGGGNGGSGGAVPAATPTPASDPASPPSKSVSSPKPVRTPPEATTSSPSSPEPAPAPGNSNSAAAAEHASERGIEASSSSGPAAAAADSTSGPGNGNGLAKGLSK
jgi:hypothetical protein